jgi:hypothetical protein
MKAVIYFTEIPPQYEHKNMGHMTGEKLLEEALLKEYGRKLAFEPRAKGEHGKPFFTLQPKIHYNISHSGKYVVCVLAGEEVGIDIQEHRELDYEKGLQKLVPVSLFQEILESDHIKEAFYDQWVLREAYMKWTGKGFSRDPRTIPMDRGSYAMLEMEPGYSGAVWSEDPLELRWEYLEISIP